MIKQINISNEKESLEALKKFQEKCYFSTEIKFKNTNLKALNEKLKNTFSKNDLFANGVTLYEMTQPTGGRGTHNYHGLTINEVYEAIHNISKSDYIFKSADNRYILITTVVATCKDRIIAIIDTDARLLSNKDAKINKLVTLYPKRNSEKLINDFLLK